MVYALIRRHVRAAPLAIAYIGLVTTTAGALAAQSDSVAQCSYAACALRIAPVWNGLDVVRGAHSGKVAGLGFFWSNDISATFVSNDSARAYGRRAMRARAVAATFTDVGAILLTIGVVRASRDGDISRTAAAFGVPGLAVLGISVPLQFAADAHLSSAVWWHNRRFSQ